MMNTKMDYSIITLLLPLMLIGCATVSQAKMPDYNSRRLYVENHPGLSSEIKQAILKGKVIEGTTKQDVLATWGEPSRIFHYDGSDETYGEHWYYDQPIYSFAPRRTVRFSKSGIVNYVSERYK